MDPASLTASISTLVDITVRAVIKTCRYVKALKSAPQELRTLISEVSTLNGILFGIKTLLEADGLPENDEESPLAVATKQHLKECEEVLKDLEKLFTNAEKVSNHSVKTIARGLLKRSKTTEDLSEDGPVDLSTVAKYLLLPESIGEIKKILIRLERMKSTLSLAIVTQESSDIQEIKQILVPEKMRRLKKLLCTADSSAKHAAVVDQREKGTGKWMITGETFLQWTKGKQQILWLSGIAGSGKTVLTSRAIDYLAEHASKKVDGGVAITYFYCDFNDAGTTAEKSVIGGLLRSLLARDPALYNTFAKDFQKELSGEGESQLQEDAKNKLSNVLLATCRRYGITYVVVDALDECVNPGNVAKALRDLANQCQSIRLLFSSREDAGIQKEMADCQRLWINDLNHADLRQYVVNELARRAERPDCCVLADITLRNEVAERIVRDATGMFQWAVCQIDHISYLPNAIEVRRSLDKLPPDLSTTYQTMIKGIADRGTVFCVLAQRTLQILASTRTTRALQARQLQEALAMDDSLNWLNASALTNLPVILSACGRLVRFDAGNVASQTAVSHQSIIDYLGSEQCRLSASPAQGFYLDPSKFHAQMAARCIKYLLFDQFFDMPSDAEMQKWKESSSFLNYSIAYWIDHVSAAKPQDRPVALIRRFLGTEEPEYFDTYRKYCTKCLWLYTYPRAVCAARVGPVDILSTYTTTIARGELIYAISWAAHDGRHDSLNCLLKIAKDKEYDFIINDWGTPLHRAIFTNQVEAAKALLAHGVGLNIQATRGTPLQSAVWLGRTDIVRLLLEQKADVNFDGDPAWELDAKEIQDQGSPRGQPVQEAELRAQTLKFLCADDLSLPRREPSESDFAPDPEARIVANTTKPYGVNKWNYGPPLTGAAIRGYDVVLQDLLKAGANVNKIHGGYGTALSGAAKSGQLNNIRKLIKAGANVNLIAGIHGTALRSAVVGKNLSCVKALVAAGADVNTRGSYFGTALKLAKDNGSTAIVDYLLQSGAKDFPRDAITPDAKSYPESYLESLMGGFWTGYFYSYDSAPDFPGQTHNAARMRIRFFPSNSFAKVAKTDHMPLFGIGTDSFGEFDLEGIVTSNSLISVIKTYKEHNWVWHNSGFLHENLNGRTCIGGSWGKPGKEPFGTFEVWRVDRFEEQAPSRQSSGAGSEIFETARKPRKVQTLPVRLDRSRPYYDQQSLSYGT